MKQSYGSGKLQTERRNNTRRSQDMVTLALVQKQIDEMHSRVFDGLGKEIREEVKKEVGGIRNLFIGILISLVLALAGIVVEGRISSSMATSENERNYKAIVDIGLKLDRHILTTEE